MKQPRLPQGVEVLETRDDGLTLVSLPAHPRDSYPLWDAKALQKDIDLARDNIAAYNLAIADQERMIAEREAQIAQTIERDLKIAAWQDMYGDLHG